MNVKEIRRLVGLAKIEEALAILKHDDAPLFKNQFNSAKRQKMLGTISQENWDLARNKVVAAILSTCDDYERRYGRSVEPYYQKSQIEVPLPQNVIVDFSQWVANCDPIRPDWSEAQLFWEDIRNWIEGEFGAGADDLLNIHSSAYAEYRTSKSARNWAGALQSLQNFKAEISNIYLEANKPKVSLKEIALSVDGTWEDVQKYMASITGKGLPISKKEAQELINAYNETRFKSVALRNVKMDLKELA